MEKYSAEERSNMKDFIKRTFKGNVKDTEMETDEQLEKLYNEAHNYSDWGL